MFSFKIAANVYITSIAILRTVQSKAVLPRKSTSKGRKASQWGEKSYSTARTKEIIASSIWVWLLQKELPRISRSLVDT